MRLDPLLVEIAADADPSRRIAWLLDAARDLLHADDVAFVPRGCDGQDAAPEQSGALQLTVGVQGVMVAVEVTDTRSGMPPEVQAPIFEPLGVESVIGKPRSCASGSTRFPERGALASLPLTGDVHGRDRGPAGWAGPWHPG